MDLHKFVWIADPQLSPDGSRVACVRVSVNSKGDGYDTSLWLAPAALGAEPHRLTGGTRDLSPRWSPDGKRIAFVRAQQIHILSMEGGEARQLTDLLKGAGAPEWSPDGKTLAFTSTTRADEPVAGKDDGYKSDVRVITRATYRTNGIGYLDPTHPTHIWAIEANTDSETRAKPKQLTSGDFEEGSLSWSPDGSRIYFISNRVADPEYQPPDSDVYSISRDGGSLTRVASIDGLIRSYQISPDGKRIAFIGALNAATVRSYNEPDLFVAPTTSDSQPKNLTAMYDFDIGGALTGDQAAPRGGLPGGPIWTSDGASIIVSASEHGRANLKRIDAASGTVADVTTGDQEVVSYTRAGSTLALIISTATDIGDLFVMKTAGGDLSRVTSLNQPLFSTISITKPEEFWFSSVGGTRIQGWIQKPPDFDASRKYPLILDIHGGPHAAWGYTFMHEFQWMAARGYVVVYVNPRGSTSYGQEFANLIHYRDPGDEYRDLMTGVDEVIKRGYIDIDRLVVTGGSYGGYLNNWVVTQTERFKAAVSQRSIADLASWWYTRDLAQFQRAALTSYRGSPFEDPGDYAQRSPITYVANVTTPLMLIEGETDFRVPAWMGGEQMFRALKYLKRETVMVRFPDETHDLSRSGKPWHRVERLQHIVGWFDKYLQMDRSSRTSSTAQRISN